MITLELHQDLSDLLESFVVDKACRILWNVQLPFLKMFSKLPARETIRCYIDSLFQKEIAQECCFIQRCVETVRIHDCSDAGTPGVVRQLAAKV